MRSWTCLTFKACAHPVNCSQTNVRGGATWSSTSGGHPSLLSPHSHTHMFVFVSLFFFSSFLNLELGKRLHDSCTNSCMYVFVVYIACERLTKQESILLDRISFLPLSQHPSTNFIPVHVSSGDVPTWTCTWTCRQSSVLSHNWAAPSLCTSTL